MRGGAVLGALLFARPAQAGDPELRWYTIESERVVVHFHGGLEPLAQRTAALATRIDERLAAWLGRRPRDKTEILLVDSSDSANGIASVLPYSKIQLFATAPEDLSLLSDYDDWLPTLLAHEQTHINHIDSVSGLPALVSQLLGKQTAPNQMQPRWLIEGMAILSETRLSSGGRLRSPLFDMMLRADVVDGNFASLDQISGDPVRWPSGTLYYLYGAKFVEYLAELYGEGLFGTVVTDSGDDVVPYAVSRPFYRATGRTLDELYAGFRRATEQRVQDELGTVAARGLREGRRLTAHGRQVAAPQFFPLHCRPELTLLYARNDGNEVGGYYEFAVGKNFGRETLLTRASGDNATVGRDCAVWFESSAPSARRYSFTDIFRQAPHTRAPSGTERTRERWTVGRRASDPAIAPDGRHLVYVTNRVATTTLRIARVSPNGSLEDERALVPSAQNEQVYTPRYSHDGKRVAYSAWSRGGYRDLRIVEVETGKVTELWRDRAIDQHPAFSPDDQTLYFSSDRSGISNIYAYDLSTGRLRQVTNVRTGAFMPEPSPDGRSLAYVGYGTGGYDLYLMELDERQFLLPQPVAPEQAQRGDRPILASAARLPVRPYSPWATLRPRALQFDYKNDESGQRLILALSGSDVVGLHEIATSVVFEPEGNSPDLYANYRFHGLPIGFEASGYRISDPNLRYDYGSSSQSIVEVRTGASTRLRYDFSSEYAGQWASLSHSLDQVAAELPTGDAADPFATVPVEPRRGLLSTVGLNYGYSNAQGTTYGSGNERGISLTLGVYEAHEAFGSKYRGTTATARTVGYLTMPWSRHHVAALSGSLGASTGEAGSAFALGGYQDSGLLEGMMTGLGQSRHTLRGYPSGWFRGTRMLLGQLEYRAPLATLDRGLSTLPIYLQRLHGAVGLDVGGAFDRVDPSGFESLLHYGGAAELWLDIVFGYRIGSRLLIGYAFGEGEGAIAGGTGYIVVGSSL